MNTNTMNTNNLWTRFNEYFLRYNDLGVSVDISRMHFPDGYFEDMAPLAAGAFADMAALEGGAIANPDENRMVGHYWLRTPSLAPERKIAEEIGRTRNDILAFARSIHCAETTGCTGKPFTHLLVVGIGGSALGPQFIADALGSPNDRMQVAFLDNTDPDGMARTLDSLSLHLESTLTVVISKSGGTKETRNGMLVTQAAFKAGGLDFAANAVAVTGEGSQLDQVAKNEGWLKRFPMWDWVGGRTSVMSAVGLLPAALQGVDVAALLDGASAMDARTRMDDTRSNAAMLLALMWHHAGGGRGAKDMVVLPYKDRLMLFSKYLQQLVMESLGKEKDLDGKVVNQGIAVYGNKGSTDQHAYIQQLRDGVDNFFATFIEVGKSQSGSALEVEPGVTSGDYLQGFLRGTREALSENGRESITIRVEDVSPATVGMLVALYERAVGFYASLIRVNAYHQPGVEAGKMAASRILEAQAKLVAALGNTPESAETLAKRTGSDPETAYHILVHLAANCADVQMSPGSKPSDDTFQKADA